MSTTRKNRLLNIKTPLADNFLLLNSVSIDEEISELFTCKVELLHEENKEDFKPTDVNIAAILGKGVTISIRANASLF